ncbi:hypothetical protein GIB67_017043 [Kingdonia uniflora]|uniref:GRF-type domain-containing protein n=2 Tax=Kingdonia uniflora TaxID=39325 RepID=A0A7J7NCV6_9MAGN|nr:hypothetical protein GIB67_017043 [Kingdonia uniflora]
MAQVRPPYTCRAGYMRRYRANTKNNNGRYFYRCPQFKNQCKSFIWEDVLVGGLRAGDLGQGGEQMDHPIVELDNDNEININLDGDDMEMEGIDGPLSEARTGDESVGTLARKPGQFSHGVNDVEESPESASNGGNGPSGSGV